jgi:hypothetical protein
MKNFVKLIMLAMLLVAGHAHAAFVGVYDVANWTSSINGGSINTSGAPGSIALTSSNNGGGIKNQDFTVTASASGVVSFDWNYVTNDTDGSFYDPFGFLHNSTFIQLTTNGLYSQTGSFVFNVLAGDIFGFRANSFDSIFGAATTTVSNFNGPSSVPVPGALWLVVAPLMSLLVKKRKVA